MILLQYKALLLSYYVAYIVYFLLTERHFLKHFCLFFNAKQQ